MSKRWIFFLVLVCSLIFPWPQAGAQDILVGGQGSNLIVREGKVQILKETLEIKLHLGFAEIEQDFTIKNGDTAQKVVFGFPYRLGRSEQSLNNFRVTANGIPVEVNSTKESDIQEFIYWKIFELQFAPNQTGNIKIKHWQMNGANIRGMRTFNYSLKNQLQTEIKEFNLRLVLMDGVNLDNFNRSVNLDLDLKLEPLGWKQDGAVLTWSWADFTPSFNMVGNFYWPGGDLAKTANLSQNLGLYQINASSNNEQANLLGDSSYLSAWAETASGSGLGETLNLEFPAKKITDFRIIPGLATSTEDYFNSSRPHELTLDFGNGKIEVITLSDEMVMQSFKLAEPVTTSSLKITLNSVYAGNLLPDDTYITEIELGADSTDTEDKDSGFGSVETRPAWQKFFVNLWASIWHWLKNIFI